MNIVEYPDREILMIDLADKLASDLGQCLVNHDRATLALPGGTTPGPVFDTLCGIDLHWSRIRVIPTDERWVPDSSDRSNARLLRQRLLREKAAAAQLVPLYRAADRPEDVLDALSGAVADVLPIDVALLGMGADMHTASLFPGAEGLDRALADDAPVLMPIRAPGAPEPRVTLTAPVLRAATTVHILITGAEKRAALERAHGLPAIEAPVAAVLGGATIHWAE